MVVSGARTEAPTLVLDGGDLFWKTGVIPESRLSQQRVKAQLQAEAYALAGLDALVPGEGDLALGADFFAQVVQAHSLPVVAANLVCGDQSFQPTTVVEKGGWRFGILGVVEGAYLGCEVGDPLASATAAMADMGEVDVTIGMVHGSRGLEEELAEALALDFVINGHTRTSHRDPDRLESGSYALAVGSRGKRLGRLDLEFVSGASGWRPEEVGQDLQARLERFEDRVATAKTALDEAADARTEVRAARRLVHYEEELAGIRAQIAEAESLSDQPRHVFRHQHVDLDDDLGEHAATQALVEAAKAKIGEVAVEAGQGEAVNHGDFVGSVTCRGCHTAQYAQWSQTRHARAYESLVHASRHMDQDCFSCHVTGAFHVDGPQLPAHVGMLKNVGCESCHGPGRNHPGPDSPIHREAGTEVCTACHDGERDEGRFDEESYRLRVIH